MSGQDHANSAPDAVISRSHSAMPCYHLPDAAADTLKAFRPFTPAMPATEGAP
jgi:hypothetical protein